MKLTVVSLLLISTSSFAAMSSKEFQAKLDDIYTKQTPRFEGCTWQNNVLKKPSFVTLDQLKHEDQFVELKINETEAMKILEKYDVKKDFLEAREAYKNVLLNNCTSTNLDIFRNYKASEDLCEYPLDDMGFFMSMIFASKNQSWKNENVTKLKEVIMSSIKNNINNDPGVLTYLTQLTILEAMVKYKIVNGIKLKDVSELRTFAETSNRKINPKGDEIAKTSCDDTLKRLKENNKLKKELKEKTLKILGTLK